MWNSEQAGSKSQLFVVNGKGGLPLKKAKSSDTSAQFLLRLSAGGDKISLWWAHHPTNHMQSYRDSDESIMWRMTEDLKDSKCSTKKEEITSDTHPQ